MKLLQTFGGEHEVKIGKRTVKRNFSPFCDVSASHGRAKAFYADGDGKGWALCPDCIAEKVKAARA